MAYWHLFYFTLVFFAPPKRSINEHSSLMFFTDCGSSKPIGTVCLAKIDTKLSLVPLEWKGFFWPPKSESSERRAVVVTLPFGPCHRTVQALNCSVT